MMLMRSRSIILVCCLFQSAACLAGRTVVSTNKNGGHSKTYPLDSDSTKLSRPGRRHGLISSLRSVFLPAGFPQSTPPGYLSFATFNAIQDLSTQLRGILATQRILEGVGVGRADATAASAVINFLVRDGCGMVATLLFTAGAAANFAGDVKRWRLFADIMVDVGITLEVAATQAPSSLFLPLISLGNMCKAICGVAAGACGGAIHLHWASRGTDIADIQAKFGSQHTVTASLGLVVAALTARSLGGVPTKQLWTWYFALTALHVWANRKCMRLMSFANMNTVRIRMLLKEFILMSNQSPEQKRTISTPAVVAAKEPLLFLPSNEKTTIEYGVSFNQVVQQSGRQESFLRTAIQQSSRRYWVFAKLQKGDRGDRVMVILNKDASPMDQAKSYFHAFQLGLELEKYSGTPSSDIINEIETKLEQEIELLWETFAHECEASGWDLEKTELQTQGYEIEIVS